MANKDDDNSLVPKSEHVNDLIPVELPSAWGSSQRLMKAVEKSIPQLKMKHGMYAAIPIVCRGHECPYAKTCPLLREGLAPTGERCPIEISMILTKFEDYCSEFDIDQQNVVDMSMVKDLIDVEIQINRADNILAIDGSFMQEIVVAVSENGDEIVNPQIHKASDYKDRLLKRKHDILHLMNSTRKDKAGDKLTVQLDPSSYASKLMAQVAEMNHGRKVIDVEDLDDEDDDE